MTIEPYRPAYHYTPPTGWMSDPNGLVYCCGEYHLFYQYHPHDNTWGPMHWGHAVSRDLVRWENLPIALFPDERLGYIFSGCVVADDRNTSGLFPAGEGGLVAVFTQSSKRQQQCVAVSSDRGRSWTKYPGNPVIPNPEGGPLPADFRDPNVRWNDLLGEWLMVLAAKDRVELWTSPNLLRWTRANDFRPSFNGPQGVWECPSLTPLRVEGSGATRWILVCSINPGGPNAGGSATQYFVGDLVVRDGRVAFESSQKGVKWLDWGKDNYAGLVWSGTDEPLFIGWMSNWQYADRVPTAPWRGAMTMVRRLALRLEQDEPVVASVPDSCYQTIALGAPVAARASSDLHEVPGLAVSRVDVVFKPASGDHGIEFLSPAGDLLRVGVDPASRTIYVDRSRTGGTRYSWDLGGKQKAPLPSGAGAMQVEIYLDTSSVEVYFDNGDPVITDLVFPEGEWTSWRAYGDAQGEVLIQPLAMR